MSLRKTYKYLPHLPSTLLLFLNHLQLEIAVTYSKSLHSFYISQNCSKLKDLLKWSPPPQGSAILSLSTWLLQYHSHHLWTSPYS